ncbi:MAG: hypothetical protein ACI31E_05955 [Muribaculaceae bacterium]
MAKYLRYQGEFLSRASVIWRAEIWQESDTPFAEVGQLTFEAEEALVIDYPLTAKHDVICGSSATLQIESPGDRTYVDLYTINPGDIRLDVYRSGSLYWSGTLDPEFYEEPYEKAFRYPVSLTFSDFSILDRLSYDFTGMQTVGDILNEALTRSGISVQSVDTSMISTCISGSPMSLSDLKVRSDNFYDEDGEPMSLKEVIEGIFLPLGLRIVQRDGKIYVYDLNGLYNASESLPVLWDGDSSTLGVDAVYNNAKITWNQYAQSGNSASEECWTADCDLSLANPNNAAPKTDSGCQYLSYHYDTDLQTWLDLTDVGFTLWTSTEGENATLNTTKYPALRFFKIAPQYSGEECEGVAVFWNGFRGYFNESSAGIKLHKVRYGVHPLALKGTASKAGDILFSSEKVWIPQVSDSEARQLLVRIKLNLLVDPRFNPWEQAENLTPDEPEKDWQGAWKARGNFLYVPVTIKFQPDGSDEVYCWDNASVIRRDVDKYVPSFDLTLGEWKAFDPTKDEAPDTWGYLAYYSPTDRKESSGAAQGWAENRPTINPTLSRLSTLLQKCEAGQYLRYPTLKYNGSTAAGRQTSGSLWLEVRAGGWIIADGGVNIDPTKVVDTREIWGADGKSPKINWVLARLPEIEIVSSNQLDEEINTDDIEYNAELHPQAKDPLDLDTVCGSSTESVPMARGAYFNAATGTQIHTLTRAGRTACIEELLIGTLYSQYADRRTKLTGEAELHASAVLPYTETNQGDKRFILLGETQNAISDTTEMTLVELRPDEYDKDNGEEIQA